MIFYGTKASKIGEFEAGNSKCLHCEKTGTQRIAVFGKYFYVYWIPFFPTGKEAVAECVHCKRTLRQNELPNELRDVYHSSQIKRPFWHWTGLGIIGVLFALMSIINPTKEVDPRSELLKADLERTSVNPTMESDSISFKLKAFFNDNAIEEIKPSEFEFLTKVKDNKVLILAKLPDLKKVRKEGRDDVVEMIQLIADTQESISDMDKYIGVHGTYNMMMVKTPVDYQNGNVVSDEALLEFYGPQKPKGQ